MSDTELRGLQNTSSYACNIWSEVILCILIVGWGEC